MQASNISVGFPTLNEQQDIISKNMGQQLMSPTYIKLTRNEELTTYVSRPDLDIFTAEKSFPADLSPSDRA
jgi:hypothetical protein